MATKKPDWLKIENEYITTKISLRKLAEKYKISFNTLKDRATREKWNSQKQETHNKIIAKTQQKTVEKISDKQSDRNAVHINAYDLLVEKIIEKITKGTYQTLAGKNPKIYVLENDLGQLAKAATALDKIQKGHRLAENILSELDKQKLDLDKQKLEIEKKKNEPGCDPCSEIDKDSFINALNPKEDWGNYESETESP